MVEIPVGLDMVLVERVQEGRKEGMYRFRTKFPLSPRWRRRGGRVVRCLETGLENTVNNSCGVEPKIELSTTLNVK